MHKFFLALWETGLKSVLTYERRCMLQKVMLRNNIIYATNEIIERGLPKLPLSILYYGKKQKFTIAYKQIYKIIQIFFKR